MSGIRRRDFVILLGCGTVAAWPLAARAQQAERVRLLVAMMGGRNADTDLEARAFFVAFRQALQELGWVEGRNFRADYRWPSGDLDRTRAIAKEFVDLKPDVIFAADATVRQRFADQGQDIPSREQQTPEALAAQQKAEIEKWWPILKAANIKGE